MGRQVYLSDRDIEVLEMLETLFDAEAGNTGAYSEEEELAAEKLFDKVLGRK